MSSSKVILWKFILTCFILSVDSTSFEMYKHTCENIDAGIKSLAPESKIPGRYTGKLCYNKIEVDSVQVYVHLEYLKDLNEEQCHIALGETPVYHSQVEDHLLYYRYRYQHCPVVCGKNTFDLIFNGCYKITLRIMDDNFKPISNNTFAPYYQYIKDSKDAEYFKVEPSVTLLNDGSNYIDIIWNTGNIPVPESFKLKLCLNNSLDLDSDFKDCYLITFCESTDTYTVTCSSSRYKIFEIEGPKTLVFQHNSVDWKLGIFKELRTAIFKLNASFDINESNKITGKAHYFTANLTESEVTTVSTPNTKASKVDLDGDVKSGGSGAIIACVVITVLVVVIALVVRTLHVRGHLRRYYQPSFRYINPLSTNNDSDNRVMVQ